LIDWFFFKDFMNDTVATPNDRSARKPNAVDWSKTKPPSVKVGHRGRSDFEWAIVAISEVTSNDKKLSEFHFERKAILSQSNGIGGGMIFSMN
jgi:hypothetical protein